MSMAADLFVSLCYNAYGLVKWYSKACVYKNNYNTNNQALQVLWYSQIPAIILLSVISNDIKCTELLVPCIPTPSLTHVQHSPFMSGSELPVCSIEVPYCMLCTWQCLKWYIAAYLFLLLTQSKWVLITDLSLYYAICNPWSSYSNNTHDRQIQWQASLCTSIETLLMS